MASSGAKHDDPLEAGFSGLLGASPPGSRPLSGRLEDCDAQVATGFEAALAAATGLERVRAIHNALRPALAMHDAVLEGVLCPVLDRLPGSAELAARLRQGCERRAGLLERFEALSRHVAAPNVYPVSGADVEQILAELDESFRDHRAKESAELGRLLEVSLGPSEQARLGARMLAEARRAPTRVRARATRRPGTPLVKAAYRFRDRVEDWSDTHWGWSPERTWRSPRDQLVVALKRQADTAPPSVRRLLEGYDVAVEAILAERDAARTPEAEATAAHRLAAAIAIHDSVLAGVLCPLLERVPGGADAAAALRAGCAERGELLGRFEAVAHDVPPRDLYRLRREAADPVVAQLAEAFRHHEHDETLDTAGLLELVPPGAYRTARSPLEDAMWPWHSEGPAALALHMALWAGGAPTRVHPALARHPTSRLLRSFYYVLDAFEDAWSDSWLERWFTPSLPTVPPVEPTPVEPTPVEPTPVERRPAG